MLFYSSTNFGLRIIIIIIIIIISERILLISVFVSWKNGELQWKWKRTELLRQIRNRIHYITPEQLSDMQIDRVKTQWKCWWIGMREKPLKLSERLPLTSSSWLSRHLHCFSNCSTLEVPSSSSSSSSFVTCSEANSRSDSFSKAASKSANASVRFSFDNTKTIGLVKIYKCIVANESISYSFIDRIEWI